MEGVTANMVILRQNTLTLAHPVNFFLSIFILCIILLYQQFTLWHMTN